jgi:hypothetical protein
LRFIEATRFTARVQQLRAEENLSELQEFLCRNPEAGPLIKGAGGFRKIRMGLPGRGKRAGCRIIYIYVKTAARIYFAYLYPKNEEIDLTPGQKQDLKAIAKEIYEEAQAQSSFK